MSEKRKYVIDEQIWKTFVHTYDISDKQQRQFKQFVDLLLQENKKYNLTAITSIKDIVLDHLYDSLAVSKSYDMSKYQSIADVGTGGGFPGIPLAIAFPEKTVHLIETSQKKIAFLQIVADSLGLTNLVFHNIDWRTFLRKQDLKIDLFIARASLSVKELLRIYKPSSFYRDADLIYWASQYWEPEKGEEPFVKSRHDYFVGKKKRSFITFRI